ncbi:MAG: mitochondrial fission ELM1 family protein, partial [Candidatus Omnitrophica bacterium]|nr:mitochondrial fission ELM1 family protein [Candidatus Omnitrophota bacterium]
FIIEYIIYFPLSIVILLSRVLPVNLMLKLGRMLGTGAYHLLRKRRTVALANLKAAFGSKYDDKQRRKIVRKVFENLALNFTELLLVPRFDKRYFDTHVHLEHMERVDEALSQNRGIIFLTAHFGNWEISSITAALYGYKMFVLGREQKPLFLNELINRHRAKTGCRPINKGMIIREMVKSLKENGIIGMLGDQSGRTGNQMDFFGRPVFMAEGAFRIAAKTGAVILPAFALRKGLNFHYIEVEKSLLDGRKQPTEKEIEGAMMGYRDLLMRHISAHPEQWMWVNKRWKYSKARAVLLLSDGKLGHERQMQAVAGSIEKQCQSAFKQETVGLEFKNVFSRGMLTGIVFLFGRFIRNPLPYLRLVLKPCSYAKLENTYADVIICAGASTRAAALLLAKENVAKTVSVMKPVPFSERLFNLSLVPAHDLRQPRPGVVITQGALNLISPEYLEAQARCLKENIGIKNGLKIGILIGGDSKYYTLTRAAVEKLVAQVKKFCGEFDAQLLMTTSRRTAPDIDDFLRREFGAYKACVFKVFPNEHNVDYSVGGILGLSSAVIVTGESISMVSEVASAGVYPIVLSLDKSGKKQNVKHELFLKELHSANKIRLVSMDEIYAELVRFKNNPGALKKLNDREKLDAAIREKIL